MSSAMNVAGGALQTYSAMSQGMSAYNASKQNAHMLEQQAKNHYRQASLDEDRMRRSAAQAIGEQLARGAQSGVALTGSRLDNLRYSYDNIERDAANIRTNAAIEGAGLENQARETRRQGKQAKKAGLLNAIMAGVSSVASAAASSSGSTSGTENGGGKVGGLFGSIAGSMGQQSNTGYPILGQDYYNRAYNTMYGANSLLKPTSYGLKYSNKKFGSL